MDQPRNGERTASAEALSPRSGAPNVFHAFPALTRWAIFFRPTDSGPRPNRRGQRRIYHHSLRLYLVHQAAERHGIARPVVYVHVERVALAREGGEVGAARLAHLGIVDGLAALLHPLAHLGHDFDRLLGDGSVGFRADIQQVIAGVAGTGDQVPDDGLGRLPIVVGFLITPTVVHRHAGFPGALLGHDALFGGGEIALQLIAVVDDDAALL